MDTEADFNRFKAFYEQTTGKHWDDAKNANKRKIQAQKGKHTPIVKKRGRDNGAGYTEGRRKPWRT